jgi:ABC-type glycerol-3-phosphate transport system substrate-binding protein
MRLAVVLALVLAAAACGGESETRPAASTTNPGSPVAGTTLDGEQVSLDDFRGKRVFVNVWSSW